MYSESLKFEKLENCYATNKEEATLPRVLAIQVKAGEKYGIKVCISNPM
jgi:hypothetical protein